MARLAPKTATLPFLVVDFCCSPLVTVSSSSSWSKTPALPFAFWFLPYFWRQKYFRFEWSFAIFSCPSMSHFVTFVDTFFVLVVVENFALAARITIVLTLEAFDCVSVKFQSNSCVFNVMPSNFRCTYRRSDCCVLCPTHIHQKLLNGSEHLWVEFFSDAKTELGVFSLPKRNRNIRVNHPMTWSPCCHASTTCLCRANVVSKQTVIVIGKVIAFRGSRLQPVFCMSVVDTSCLLSLRITFIAGHLRYRKRQEALKFEVCRSIHSWPHVSKLHAGYICYQSANTHTRRDGAECNNLMSNNKRRTRWQVRQTLGFELPASQSQGTRTVTAVNICNGRRFFSHSC